MPTTTVVDTFWLVRAVSHAVGDLPGAHKRGGKRVPPYSYLDEHAKVFREQFEQQSEVEGFAAVTATEGDAVVGFCHGIPFQPGRWWRSATTPPPQDLLPLTKFAVIQFVVRRARQGRGIGGLLMSALLADRPEDCAILASYPDVKARQIYDRWGWRKVGSTRPPLLAEMDALALWPLRTPDARKV